MIRLAARLALGGGRDGTIRLALTAVGIAIATTMLLCAAVALPALRAHDVRRGWIDTSARNQQPAQDERTTDPLLWRVTETHFQQREVLRVDVAAEGPDAPVPPGLERLPGDGELAVSPALQDLLDRTEPAMLGDRFPGDVTATVGPDALVSPDQLVVFVGHAPDELRDQPEVTRVHSIESAPFSRSLTRIMRVAIAVGGVGLMAPVIAFVAAATRLAAARRERRLSAMRLAGATPRQIGVVAAVEAAMASVLGVVVGFGGFFALRPSLAGIPFDGDRFYPSDLRLDAWAGAGVALLVPLVAVGTAVVSLRRARISPLGAARRIAPGHPSPRPLALVALGVTGLTGVQTTMAGASDVAVATAVGGSLLVTMSGIVWSGPWLTWTAARLMARASRRAPALLAARRLQANPGAGFRAVGGLVLAVFVGTVFSSFSASVLAQGRTPEERVRPGVVAAALSLVPTADPARSAPLDAAERERLLGDLRAAAGVERVVTAHLLPDDLTLDPLAGPRRGTIEAAAIRCADLAVLGLGECEGTTALSISASQVRATGLDLTAEIPVERLDGLPTVGVAAVTDESASAVERARTQLELMLPGSVAVTQHDLTANDRSEARTTERISNIALGATLLIAGCSLLVAVAGSIVERRQPFALLRLAGTRLSDLRRIVLAEAAAPLVLVSALSAALGLGVTALTLASDSTGPSFALPSAAYWLALLAGLGVALALVAATLPLLKRLTDPQTVRFE